MARTGRVVMIVLMLVVLCVAGCRGASGSSLPANPTASLPANPTSSLANAPTSSPPSAPTSSPPSTPTSSPPSAPTSDQPGVPTSSPPGAPTSSPLSTPTSSPSSTPTASLPGDSSWRVDFGISECTMVPTGRNEYFILEPGFQLVLEHRSSRGTHEKLAITVLDETREVDRVLTRVVEEREWRNGELIEVSRNFFAVCESTNDVFYFGEEVDMYQGGQLASHSGAWLAGEKSATAGLMMPAKPEVGMKYFQEIAPAVAMDRAEVVSLDDVLETPAGTFSSCLKTREGTALNPLEQEFKIYAPEIGLIQDERLLLTEYGFVATDDSAGEGSN